MQLPRMNPFPGNNSVLIMDNCQIHKSAHIREIVEEHGMQLLTCTEYNFTFKQVVLSSFFLHILQISIL